MKALLREALGKDGDVKVERHSCDGGAGISGKRAQAPELRLKLLPFSENLALSIVT